MSTPTSWAGVNPGDYISAAEFEGRDVTMTILAIEVVDFEKEDGSGHEKRGVVSFRETERKWALNRTNAQLLSAIWPTPADAIGHKVTLTSEKVKFGRETVDGIRVKGSPELTGPVSATVKLPRKKAVTRTLVPTVRGASQERVQDAPAPVPSSAPITVECTERGAVQTLTDDATVDDIAGMRCDCGGELIQP